MVDEIPGNKESKKFKEQKAINRPSGRKDSVQGQKDAETYCE